MQMILLILLAALPTALVILAAVAYPDVGARAAATVALDGLDQLRAAYLADDSADTIEFMLAVDAWDRPRAKAASEDKTLPEIQQARAARRARATCRHEYIVGSPHGCIYCGAAWDVVVPDHFPAIGGSTPSRPPNHGRAVTAQRHIDKARRAHGLKDYASAEHHLAEAKRLSA